MYRQIPLFVCRFALGRTGGVNSRCAAEATTTFCPPGRRVGCLPRLDAVSCPLNCRRPAPSVIRLRASRHARETGFPLPAERGAGSRSARRLTQPGFPRLRLGARGTAPHGGTDGLGTIYGSTTTFGLSAIALWLPPAFACPVGRTCAQGLRLNA